MNELIGHTLNKVVYNDEEKTLSLTIDNDKIFLIKVYADCCSSGDFLKVDEPYSLPSKIVSIEEKTAEFDSNGGSYQVYQEVVILENGEKLYILYDNDSNGYYGSSLQAYYNGEQVYEFPKEEEAAK